MAAPSRVAATCGGHLHTRGTHLLYLRHGGHLDTSAKRKERKERKEHASSGAASRGVRGATQSDDVASSSAHPRLSARRRNTEHSLLRADRQRARGRGEHAVRAPSHGVSLRVMSCHVVLAIRRARVVGGARARHTPWHHRGRGAATHHDACARGVRVRRTRVCAARARAYAWAVWTTIPHDKHVSHRRPNCPRWSENAHTPLLYLAPDRPGARARARPSAGHGVGPPRACPLTVGPPRALPPPRPPGTNAARAARSSNWASRRRRSRSIEMTWHVRIASRNSDESPSYGATAGEDQRAREARGRDLDVRREQAQAPVQQVPRRRSRSVGRSSGWLVPGPSHLVRSRVGPRPLSSLSSRWPVCDTRVRVRGRRSRWMGCARVAFLRRARSARRRSERKRGR